MSGFDELFAANTEFVKNFKSQDLTGQAKKALTIVTCMVLELPRMYLEP